jgi:hypothetical protein
MVFMVALFASLLTPPRVYYHSGQRREQEKKEKTAMLTSLM